MRCSECYCFLHYRQYCTFASIPAFADVPVVPAVLLLLSFLLMGTVMQLLLSLLLWLVSQPLHAVAVIPAVTAVPLVPDVDC